MTNAAIKVGVIAEQTGPLSFMGIADANVARMVVDDINASGGLLGRQLKLYLEDGATNDSVAAARATKLIEDDRVDVLFGGIYSSTRQAIKGPVKKSGKLYIYPEQYEGQEVDALGQINPKRVAQRVASHDPAGKAAPRSPTARSRRKRCSRLPGPTCWRRIR